MQNKKLNFAAIDIGSNAVRLLIKSVNDGDSPDKMTKTVLLRVPLRLGEEVFGTGSISGMSFFPPTRPIALRFRRGFSCRSNLFRNSSACWA